MGRKSISKMTRLEVVELLLYNMVRVAMEDGVPRSKVSEQYFEREGAPTYKFQHFLTEALGSIDFNEKVYVMNVLENDNPLTKEALEKIALISIVRE